MPDVIIFVEDTYGVEFHRNVIYKLRQNGLLNNKGNLKRIYRIPAYPCTHALKRKVATRIMNYNEPQIVFVLDTEGENHELISNMVKKHFKDMRDRLFVIAVHPNHEKWLCAGLCGDMNRCKKRPKDELFKRINNSYQKYMLAQKSIYIDIHKLLRYKDFRAYVEILKKLDA